LTSPSVADTGSEPEPLQRLSTSQSLRRHPIDVWDAQTCRYNPFWPTFGDRAALRARRTDVVANEVVTTPNQIAAERISSAAYSWAPTAPPSTSTRRDAVVALAIQTVWRCRS
jgi:hypothetical protein